MEHQQIVTAFQKLESLAQGFQKTKLHIDSVFALPRGTAHSWAAEDALAHVRWMAHRGVFYADNEQLTKAQRWLSFGQGVLWAHGAGSINTFRRANMPPGEIFRP